MCLCVCVCVCVCGRLELEKAILLSCNILDDYAYVWSMCVD